MGKAILALCGLSPSKILSIASRAISFWDYQREVQLLSQAAHVRRAQNQAREMEKKWDDHHMESKRMQVSLQRQLESHRDHMEELSKESQDIKQKFADKCRQYRHLQQLYEDACGSVRPLSSVEHPSPLLPQTPLMLRGASRSTSPSLRTPSALQSPVRTVSPRFVPRIPSHGASTPYGSMHRSGHSPFARSLQRPKSSLIPRSSPLRQLLGSPRRALDRALGHL